MVLGLLRQILIQLLHMQAVFRDRPKKFSLSLRKQLVSFLDWLIPVNHIYRNRQFFSVASFAFHATLLIVPIALLDHIVLWEKALGISWPGLPYPVADWLTFIFILSAFVLLFYRLFSEPVRALSTVQDYVLVIMVSIPFLSGFMAAHPTVNPFTYSEIMLVHVLSSEVVFVLLPTTKLVHSVLFPFDRISSDVFWQVAPADAEQVARELRGKDARV
jgi:nitrate reductase gamma subunit